MIKIITDTSTLYTQDMANELQIDVVPLTVTINNQSYREFIEIDSNQFYEIIKEGHIPTSSQPPIGDFLELFEKYKDDEVIVITMADGLSGTYQSCLSAQQMSEHPRIKVINSKTLCVPHRQIVQDAVEMRDHGHTFDEIVAMVETKRETSHSFLLPQDFGFLKRGGRLTTLAATLGGLLKIQPVVTQTKDGTRLEKFGVGRNFKGAVKKVLEHLKHEGVDNSFRFGVSHAFTYEQAQQVAQMIKEKFNVTKVEIEELSCAFITQGGPLCLAIQVIAS